MTDSSRLVMSQGPQPGQTFTLDQDLLTLGRDPGGDIVINDPQVSRQHARITCQGELILIEDLGSTNGTFVNGMRLTGPHTLANGDVISLGDAVTLTFYGAGIATTEPLAGQPTLSSAAPSYGPPPPAFEAAPPPAQTATPPPPPAYAAAPPVEAKKSNTGLWVGCGCLVLILGCIAVGLFVWYAPESFWQALIDIGIPVPTWPF
jgi:predicted component of type VI protein secretion system